MDDVISRTYWLGQEEAVFDWMLMHCRIWIAGDQMHDGALED